jgi:MFS family permease
MRDKKLGGHESGSPTSAVAAPEAPSASLRDWLLLALLTSAMAFSYIDRYALALLMEPIKHALKVNDAQLGMINGIAFGVFFTFMGIPLGRLADRWSRKGTIMVGMSIWMTATAICGLASNFVQLFIGRIGVGAGEAGLSPASYSLIYDRFPRTLLAVALSIAGLGASIGAGVAYFYAGSVYQLFQDGIVSGWPIVGHLAAWQQTFIAVALPGIPLMAFLVFIREPKRRAATLGVDTAPKLTVSQVKDFALLFLAFSGGVLTSNVLFTWTPALLAREYHWTPKLIGSTYGVILMVAAPVGMLAGGWISDQRMRTANRGDHIPIALWSAATALPLMLGVGFCSNPALLLSLVAIMHFFLSMAYGVFPAYIQLKAPAVARAQISALYVLIINLVSQGVGPILIGFISNLRPNEPTALRFAMVSVSVPFLAATSISLFLIGRRERIAAAPSPPNREDLPG